MRAFLILALLLLGSTVPAYAGELVELDEKRFIAETVAAREIFFNKVKAKPELQVINWRGKITKDELNLELFFPEDDEVQTTFLLSMIAGFEFLMGKIYPHNLCALIAENPRVYIRVVNVKYLVFKLVKGSYEGGIVHTQSKECYTRDEFRDLIKYGVSRPQAPATPHYE